MVTVQLIHWNEQEAAALAARFDPASHRVRYEVPQGPQFFKDLQLQPPDVIIIELSRLPSQGRDVGVTLRKTAGTRRIPLIFVGGSPPKVRAIRSFLPDAAYATWESLPEVMQDSLANPPEDPVVPSSVFEAYRGRALTRKLGIKAHSRVVVKNAPAGFDELLGGLPDGAVLTSRFHASMDLVIWFVTDQQDLARGMRKMAERMGEVSLWIAWPKQAPDRAGDLTQQVVRQAGLTAGLVDYKICSIDATWSGLLFTRRKPGAAA